MIFGETAIRGVFVLDLAPIPDERGFFARAYSADQFQAHGLNPYVHQASLSANHRRGTLRGMHYQHPPCAEAKLVRCIKGAIFDVAVDLREDSETYLQWVAFELTAENRRAMYLPEGCAHGYQTLEDESDVFYLVSAAYAPDLAGGIRYDDPVVGIQWPLPVSVISPRDASWPLLTPTAEVRR